MINLSKRSYQKELLDSDAVPFTAIQQNMKELNYINTFLGGHAITIEGVKKIIRQSDFKNNIHICEIGCGGGDNLKALNQWAKKQQLNISFTGVDIKPECIAYAKIQCVDLNADWVTNDYNNLDFKNNTPTIIFSSLFCHHFTEVELCGMLQWMKINSTAGFFINDLHRHPLAYYSIKFITSIFSSSYLVKNDAPLSVARGFTKKEWQTIFSNSSINKYYIQWKWAFRHLIVYCNEQNRSI